MEIWEALAREQIRQTVSSYTFAGDRGRAAELGALFAADGILELDDGRRFTGPGGVAELIAHTADLHRDAVAPTQANVVHHHVSSVHIHALTSDSARVSSYFVVFTQHGPDHWGRYQDIVVPADEGRWLFAHRSVRTEGYDPRSEFRLTVGSLPA